MDKNSINHSYETLNKAPSTRHEKKDEQASTMEYFRRKPAKKSRRIVRKNSTTNNGLGRTEVDTPNTEVVEKIKKEKPKKKKIAWLKEYIGFVHCNSPAPIVKQALFNAGITPDLFPDIEDEFSHFSKYDPRHNDDVKEI